MYIKLLGADASANNLGQIETVTLDSTTLEIMRNMTRFSIYSPVSYELDKFIKTLKDNDIWDSIQLLYFPWLAGQVDELLYNPQGVSLSFREGAEECFFVDEGIIYLKSGTYSSALSLVEILMPNYDIQGKYISIGNIDHINTASVISDSATGTSARPIINIGTQYKGVINGSYNWNYGWGGIRNNTQNLACTFLVPSSGFPTGLKVTDTSHNIVDAYVYGSGQTVPSSFVFSSLHLGGLTGSVTTQDVSLTGTSNASYVLGNSTLTEAKAKILDSALNELMQFMRALA